MNMERKYIRRRRITVWAAAILLVGLFTHATRDTCYVGEGGNALGYGSCTEMIDKVIEGGK
jgi:hypothetical protein